MKAESQIPSLPYNWLENLFSAVLITRKTKLEEGSINFSLLQLRNSDTVTARRNKLKFVGHWKT